MIEFKLGKKKINKKKKEKRKKFNRKPIEALATTHAESARKS
jgi:hypothetical protein